MAKLNEKEIIKAFKEIKDLLEDLSATYDLSEHSEEVEDAVFLIEEIIGSDSKKKKKTNWKEEIVEHYLELFDRYPTLEVLPIYSWGRYYKYESAGRPFECVAGERGFIDFMCDINNGEDLKDRMDEELLETIDEENEEFDGYYPNREDVVNEFGGDDDRGGMCLVIAKNKTKTGYHYSLEVADCDSPE